ncbi:MAG: hypothetical protein RBT15_07205 [Gudongella sp.]|nr:hypothetical protein [Gudongella sp.]
MQSITNSMKLHKRAWIKVFTVLFLMVAAAYVHLYKFATRGQETVKFLIIFFLYIAMIATWGVSIRRRIVHKKIRHFLLVTTALMVFLFFMRTMRYMVFLSSEILSAYAWYSYYIPILLIALLALWASFYLGERENYSLKPRYYLLLIPTIILLFGIMTNEYHFFAFKFPTEIRGGKYSYGFLYYATISWVLLIIVVMIANLYRKSRVPGTNKRIWLPMIVVGLHLTYIILYSINPSRTRAGFIEIVVMTCAATVALWESCVQTGLFHSNSNYDKLLKDSILASQIIDYDFNVHYRANNAPILDESTIRKLIVENKVEISPDKLAYIYPINGGFTIWQDDVSDISRLVAELSDIEDELKDSTDLLKEEYTIRSKQIRVEERLRLYKILSNVTKGQIEQIKALLNQYSIADEECKREILLRINILGVYIKRRSNLILMAEGNESVTGDDLKHCIRESADNLKLWGIQTAMSIAGDNTLNTEFAMLCYDLFEAVIEESFGDLKTIYSVITERKDSVIFTIQAESTKKLCSHSWSTWQEERVKRINGVVKCDLVDKDIFSVSISIPKEGE